MALEALESSVVVVADTFLAIFRIIVFIIVPMWFLIVAALNFKADGSTTKPTEHQLAEWAQNLKAALALRGQFQEWLIDEAYALQIFIWDAERCRTPELVCGVAGAQEAFERIQELKAHNAEALLQLAERDPALPMTDADLSNATKTWDSIKATCDRVNTSASLSPTNVKGYRVPHGHPQSVLPHPTQAEVDAIVDAVFNSQ